MICLLILGRSQDGPKHVDSPLGYATSVSHAVKTHTAWMFVCLSFQLHFQSTSTWWLSVPVSPSASETNRERNAAELHLFSLCTQNHPKSSNYTSLFLHSICYVFTSLLLSGFRNSLFIYFSLGGLLTILFSTVSFHFTFTGKLWKTILHILS